MLTRAQQRALAENPLKEYQKKLLIAEIIAQEIYYGLGAGDIDFDPYRLDLTDYKVVNWQNPYFHFYDKLLTGTLTDDDLDGISNLDCQSSDLEKINEDFQHSIHFARQIVFRYFQCERFHELLTQSSRITLYSTGYEDWGHYCPESYRVVKFHLSTGGAICLDTVKNKLFEKPGRQNEAKSQEN